jgi:hypothetical protein
MIFLLCGFFGLLPAKTGSESLPGTLVGRGGRWFPWRSLVMPPRQPVRDKHSSGFTHLLAASFWPAGLFRWQFTSPGCANSGVERGGINNDRAVFANEPHQRSYTGLDRLAQFLADNRKVYSISKRLRTNLARENHRIWNEGWYRGSKPLEDQTSVSLFTTRNPRRCNHVASERVYGNLSGLRRPDLDRHSRANVS